MELVLLFKNGYSLRPHISGAAKAPGYRRLVKTPVGKEDSRKAGS